MSHTKPSKKTSDTGTGSTVEADNNSKSLETEKGNKHDKDLPDTRKVSNKSKQTKKGLEKSDIGSETSSLKTDLTSCVQTLKSENEKMMKSMMDSMFDKWKAQLCEFNQSNQASVSQVQARDSHDNESAPVEVSAIDLHASQDDLAALDDCEERNSSKSENMEGSIFETGSNVASEASCFAEDLKWASVIRQLPMYYGGDLTLEEGSSQEHTSFVSTALYKPKKESAIPKLPLDGSIKNKWDTMSKAISKTKGTLSAFNAKDNRRFRIAEEDFDKYAWVPAIDKDYRAKLELDDKLRKPFDKKAVGIKPGKKQPIIRDPNLRIAEGEFYKCDESARVVMRASSHATLMVNAVNTILSEPDKYQREEALNLVQAVYESVQAMADAAIRISARATVARRRICLSQLQFKDSLAVDELMKLPLDGKSLFHEEFNKVLHTRATFARDARETSDYVTGKFQGFKRGHSQTFKEGPPQKRAKKDPIKFSGTSNQVEVQGQVRKVTGFKMPYGKQNQSFRFQSKQDRGNKPNKF